jgi:hypothetical protein
MAWGYSGGVYPCRHLPNGTFPCAASSYTVQPNFWVSFLNNTLECTNQLGLIGPNYNGVPPGEPSTGGPLVLGAVVRGNTLGGETDLVVNYSAWNVVLEANTLVASGRCNGPGGTESPAGVVRIDNTSTHFVWTRE